MWEITKKMQREAAKAGVHIKTSAEIVAEREKMLADKYKATTLEQRTIFMDAFRKGKTIGEAKDMAGVDLDTATEIILHHIKKVEYLDPETH